MVNLLFIALVKFILICKFRYAPTKQLNCKASLLIYYVNEALRQATNTINSVVIFIISNKESRLAVTSWNEASDATSAAGSNFYQPI